MSVLCATTKALATSSTANVLNRCFMKFCSSFLDWFRGTCEIHMQVTVPSPRAAQTEPVCEVASESFAYWDSRYGGGSFAQYSGDCSLYFCVSKSAESL